MMYNMVSQTRENVFVVLVLAIVIITVIGAIFWGCASITGSPPTFFNKTVTNIVYGIIGIAGVILAVLLGLFLYSVFKRKGFDWKHFVGTEWIH